MHQEKTTAEHLLLALVREPEGVAVGIIDSLGISIAAVYSYTAKVL